MAAAASPAQAQTPSLLQVVAMEPQPMAPRQQPHPHMPPTRCQALVSTERWPAVGVTQFLNSLLQSHCSAASASLPQALHICTLAASLAGPQGAGSPMQVLNSAYCRAANLQTECTAGDHLFLAGERMSCLQVCLAWPPTRQPWHRQPQLTMWMATAAGAAPERGMTAMEAAAATAAALPAGGAPPRLAGAGEIQPLARIIAAGHGRLGVVSGSCMLYRGAAISSYYQGGCGAVPSN